MKHILLAAAWIACAGCTASLSNESFGSAGLYGGASTRHVDFQYLEADVQGGVVGIQSSRSYRDEPEVGMFSELSWGRDEDDSLWLLESKSGAETYFPLTGNLVFGANVHASYAVMSVESFRNRNYLYGGGGGLSLNMMLGNHMLLFARLEARYLWDRTKTATCVDGHTTNEGCLSHGGIDFFNDEAGRGFIFESTIGIRFGF